MRGNEIYICRERERERDRKREHGEGEERWGDQKMFGIMDE